MKFLIVIIINGLISIYYTAKFQHDKMDLIVLTLLICGFSFLNITVLLYHSFENKKNYNTQNKNLLMKIKELENKIDDIQNTITIVEDISLKIDDIHDTIEKIRFIDAVDRNYKYLNSDSEHHKIVNGFYDD